MTAAAAWSATSGAAIARTLGTESGQLGRCGLGFVVDDDPEQVRPAGGGQGPAKRSQLRPDPGQVPVGDLANDPQAAHQISRRSDRNSTTWPAATAAGLADTRVAARAAGVCASITVVVACGPPTAPDPGQGPPASRSGSPSSARP